MSLNLLYNSRVWTIDTANNSATFNVDRDFPGYGFRLGFGYIELNGTTYVLHEGDGTKRSFTSGVTTDSSYIDWNSSTKVLRYKNGTQVQYAAFPGSTTFFRPTKITDTNGNYITVTYRTDTWAKGQEIATIVDTLNRTITFNYNTTGALTGTLASIVQGSKTYAVFSWNTNYTFNYNFASPLAATNSPASGSTLTVLTGVIYANSLAVNFLYGDWGIVNQIQQLSSNGTLRSSVSYDTVWATSPVTDFPGFSHQTVYDGVNTAVYTHTIVKSGGAVSTYTIQNPSPSSTQTVTTLFTTSDWKAGLTQSVQFHSSSGAPLRTATYAWVADATTNNNPRIGNVTTRLNDSNQLAQAIYSYDSNGNVTELDEYDWGLNLARKTLTTYLGTSGYTSNHILNLAVSVTVQKPNGTAVALTEIQYDTSTSLTNNAGVVQHDDTNHGITYSWRGNPTTITRYSNAAGHSGGVVRNLYYDTVGNLLSADADCCNTIQWTYSNTTKFAYPDSVTRGPSGTQLTTSATYDFASGLPLSSTDENGKTTNFTYDPVDRPATAIRPDSVVVTSTFDDASASPSVSVSSAANSAVSFTLLDGLGRVLQQEARNGSTQFSITRSTYDAAGRLSQRSNPRKPGESEVFTTYGYDNYDRITSMAPATGGSYQTSYSGNSVTSTDPVGKQRRSFADALGRLIEVDEPGSGDGMTSTGFVTITGSSVSGDVVSITVNGLTKSKTSTCSRGVCTDGPTFAILLANSFNLDGTSSVTAAAAGSTVFFTSKTAGAATNYSLSSSTTGAALVLYNSGSNLTGGADSSGNSTLATPMITTYTYDVINDLLTVSQAKRGSLTPQSRTYAYDSLGRLTSATPAESTAATTYTYTDFSAALLRTDPRGAKTNYAYDAMNRPYTITYDVSGAPNVAATAGITYTYGTSSASNNKGRLLTADNSNESDSYSYDQLGRVISAAKTIGSNTYTIGYAYNSADQLTTLTYPSLRAVTTTYDATGRTSQLADGSRTYLTVPDTTADYTAAGQITQFNYGNGVSAYFGYNDHLQIASIRYANGSSDLLNLLYCYTTNSTSGDTCYSASPQSNNNGQIQKITWKPNGTEDTTKTQNYGYDAVHRLIAASTSDQSANGTWGLGWSYDRFGTMLQQTLTGGVLNSPYSAPSQPQLTVSATTNRITNTGYAYDAAGNMTSDGTNSFAYDAENRLVNYNSGAATYVYGPDGLRIKKTVSAAITTYVFSGFTVLAEYTGSTPALSQEYIYAGDSLLASLNSSGTPTYRHMDRLSARVETDASGAITRTFGHFPYGETWYENTGSSKWRFTTYERDGESALDYANARSYIPRLGRFLTADPLAGDAFNPQSLNRYAYVRNDPVGLVDPLGLDVQLPCMKNPDIVGRYFPGCLRGIGSVVFAYGGALALLGYSVQPIHLDLIFIQYGDFFFPALCCFTLVDVVVPAVVGGGDGGSGGGARERKRRACIARKRAEADTAKAAFEAGETKRVLVQIGISAAWGCGAGTFWGASSGAVFFGVGAIPGAGVGCFVGGVASASAGAIRAGVTVPLTNWGYDKYIYQPRYDSAEIACDLEAATKPPG
ncbi:MAG: RHS repeat-associated core domain-containing protein [Candidatus Koribacter versatilis]|uniref:RHS repeat-associated core domain-containing protein n=1 Tax=Candidatus Korobacter versatilis TaxID=658062 RepID=A0A932A971_9BACT|nr:RHS repeat-associated core domain-containing protein [Candidatus Koribacter versatilis]